MSARSVQGRLFFATGVSRLFFPLGKQLMRKGGVIEVPLLCCVCFFAKCAPYTVVVINTLLFLVIRDYFFHRRPLFHV